MNIAPQEFGARDIDIARAVYDVQRTLIDASPSEYVDLLSFMLHGNPAYEAFKQSIALHAPIEEEYILRSPRGVAYMDYVPRNPDSVPSLFKDNHLERGFLLGLHVTQKALGTGVDTEFGDCVTKTMHFQATDPRAYARHLSRIGENTYAFSLSSDTQHERATPNPLHDFMQEYAHELYGAHDIIRLCPFKVGAGIARAAFNTMSRNIDNKLRGIETVSHDETT